MARNPKKSRGPQGDRSKKLTIDFVDHRAEDPDVQLRLRVLDDKDEAFTELQISGDRAVEIPVKTLAEARTFELVAVESAGESQPVKLHKLQVEKLLEDDLPLRLPRHRWLEFLFRTVCIEGQAQHCRWQPWYLTINNQRIARSIELAPRGFSELDPGIATDLAIDHLIEPVLPGWFRCTPLCDGVVEVYRRTCCCRPLVVLDPRIPELIERLRDLLPEVPPLPDPPPPEPDWRLAKAFLRDGAEDPIRVFAETDVQAIESLDGQAQVAYIEARPYLRHLYCSCGEPHQVASGFLGPDGSFQICWREPIRFLLRGCRDEYAFRIKQPHESGTLTVYDGLAANRWFEIDEDIVLTSYHRDALVCDHPDVPPNIGTNAVMLERIGSTSSNRLHSPVPVAWDRVAVSEPNHGLAEPTVPASNPGTAEKDMAWGGNLALRYLFFEDLRPIAEFFRVSVVEADDTGNPKAGASPEVLDATRSWVWWRRRLDGTIKREVFPLGPEPGTDGLFLIPYRSRLTPLLNPGEAAEWRSSQAHAVVPTADFADARHLVRLELFDAAKNPIKPAGTSNGGAPPASDAAFTFQTWPVPYATETVEVPHRALTHLFWFDNRKTTAEIQDLQSSIGPISGNCVFLVGDLGSTLQVRYDALHDSSQPVTSDLFLLRRWLSWQRGLFGSYLTWEGPSNVAKQNDLSTPKTFGELLAGESRCTFSVRVRTRARITDGSDRIRAYDDEDIGSFAIEIEGAA